MSSTFNHDHFHLSYQKLISRAEFDIDFILLTFLAAIICFFGFKMNNASVIIGSMVISPLLSPLVAAASSLVFVNSKAFLKNFSALLFALLIVVFASFLLAKIFPFTENTEITNRLHTSRLDYFLVAFFSGIAGALAFYLPGIIEAVTGIAISVTLIPPMVLCGIGLALGQLPWVEYSLFTTVFNILGIFIGASLTIFLLKSFRRKL